MSEDLSYSSDFGELQDAYLGEGGANFSSESAEDSDLENMFADLAASQGMAELDAEGGAKKKRKKKAAAKRKAKKKAAKRKAKKKAGKRKAKKKAGKRKAKKKVAKRKTSGGAKKKAAAKKVSKAKNDSEFIHYTMVLADGTEKGDYKIRRGKQGPSAAAKKAATKHMQAKGLNKKPSGSFNIKIRQTTHGSGHNKVFEYKIEFKRKKADAAFKKLSGKDYTYEKKVTAV